MNFFFFVVGLLCVCVRIFTHILIDFELELRRRFEFGIQSETDYVTHFCVKQVEKKKEEEERKKNPEEK